MPVSNIFSFSLWCMCVSESFSSQDRLPKTTRIIYVFEHSPDVSELMRTVVWNN